jgi:hypothetical protein
MSTDLRTIANQFKFNTGLFDRIVNGIPAEQWLKQPGDDSNHLFWVAGHVIVHRGRTAALLGAEWSAPWEKLFLRGEKRAGNDQYPTVAELLAAWRDVSDRLFAAFPYASEERLSKPVERGRPSIDGTVGGTVGFLCLHEGYHIGQMGFIRKWLGHGQAVG